MKRWFRVILSMAVVGVLFVACGDDGSSDPTGSDGVTPGGEKSGSPSSIDGNPQKTDQSPATDPGSNGGTPTPTDPGSTPPGSTPPGSTPPGGTPPGGTPPGGTPPGGTPPGGTPPGGVTTPPTTPSSLGKVCTDNAGCAPTDTCFKAEMGQAKGTCVLNNCPNNEACRTDEAAKANFFGMCLSRSEWTIDANGKKTEKTSANCGFFCAYAGKNYSCPTDHVCKVIYGYSTCVPK